MTPAARRRGALALLALAGCGVAQQGCSPCDGSDERKRDERERDERERHDRERHDRERRYGTGGESPEEPLSEAELRGRSLFARLLGRAGGGAGAAPVTSLDAWVGQKCESFPNGQPDHIVETFQFTREGEIYVTTGTASGRNTYTRHGETLQHQQHAQITATLQPNGELAWSHGYGSRICGRGGGGGGGYEENWARIWCPIAGHPDMDQGAYHEPIGLCNYTTRRYEHDRPDEEIGGNCICLPLVTACWIGTLCYQPCGCICAHQVPWLGDCPCSEHRVTKHFVENYPRLVTKGPARMER